MSDDASLLLLLRLKAFATSEVIAGRLGLDANSVELAMRQLSERGHVVHRRGRAPGWSLTASGRRHGEALLGVELDTAGARRRVDAAYGEFLGHNGELLSICTDWQTVVVSGQRVPNDHTDPARDASVLARLSALHTRAVPITRALAEALSRFESYSDRLERAHARVAAGEYDWIARPTLDSYHAVWFELHEHLLATLGRERSQEARSADRPADTTSAPTADTTVGTSTQNGDRI